MVRRVLMVMIVFAGLLFVTGWGFQEVPTGFMPTEDQGYVFANIQLPDSASLPRTQQTMKQMDEILRNTPGVVDWVSVSGYSMITGASGSNQGMIFIMFKPWDERTGNEKESQEAILAHLQKEFSQLQDAVAFAFVPPSIDGLGAAGGFQMQVVQSGAADYRQLQVVAEELVRDGNGQTGLAGLNTTFRANAPQLYADVDRNQGENQRRAALVGVRYAAGVLGLGLRERLQRPGQDISSQGAGRTNSFGWNRGTSRNCKSATIRGR